MLLLQMDSERGLVKHSSEKADEWHHATSKIGRDFLVKQVRQLQHTYTPCLFHTCKEKPC